MGKSNPDDNVKNCPKCKALIQRAKFVEDNCFEELVNTVSSLLDGLKDGGKDSKGSKSPGKRRLNQEDNFLGDDFDDDDDDLELAQLTGRTLKRSKTMMPAPTISTTGPSCTIIQSQNNLIPKTSTPFVGNAGRPRDLSPFPVSFLTKLHNVAEKKGSPPKDGNNDLGKMRNQLNRKLSFEEDRRETHGLSDSSDSEDRRPRPSQTYSRFDRIVQSTRKTSSAQTEVTHSSSAPQHKDIQTDGTGGGDVLSSLTTILKCLCVQNSVHGTLFVEGLGRIEVNLSKTGEPRVSQIQNNGTQTQRSDTVTQGTQYDELHYEKSRNYPVSNAKGVQGLTFDICSDQSGDFSTTSTQSAAFSIEQSFDASQRSNTQIGSIPANHINNQSELPSLGATELRQMLEDLSNNSIDKMIPDVDDVTEMDVEGEGQREVTHQSDKNPSQINGNDTQDPTKSLDCTQDPTENSNYEERTELAENVHENSRLDDRSEANNNCVNNSSQKSNYIDSDDDDAFLMKSVFNDDDIESLPSLTPEKTKSKRITKDDIISSEEQSKDILSGR